MEALGKATPRDATEGTDEGTMARASGNAAKTGRGVIGEGAVEVGASTVEVGTGRDVTGSGAMEAATDAGIDRGTACTSEGAQVSVGTWAGAGTGAWA
ncbi:unnamed protein product [Ilex paraguariensis]|uniref:Uncharacterized protein n=1 Tax=Ilex paraguariensis TaxID=185542 RepID=A0ABC8U678_9AQUA